MPEDRTATRMSVAKALKAGTTPWQDLGDRDTQCTRSLASAGQPVEVVLGCRAGIRQDRHQALADTRPGPKASR